MGKDNFALMWGEVLDKGVREFGQEGGHDGHQVLARHGLLVHVHWVRVAADAAVDEEVRRLADVVIAVLGEAAHEADAGHLHLAAAIAAAGPVHLHHPRHDHPLLHLLRHLQRPHLGLDDGVATELAARARHKALALSSRR